MTNKNLQIATFGGGCFWCTEAVFQEIKGVVEVIPGYIDGTIKHIITSAGNRIQKLIPGKHPSGRPGHGNREPEHAGSACAPFDRLRAGGQGGH